MRALEKWCVTKVAHCIFYWLPAYLYDTLLHFTGPLPIPMVLYYFLLANCLSLWYSSSFYWPTAYTYRTLLPFTGPLSCPYSIHLSYTGSLTFHMVLFHLLMALCLYIWYSYTFTGSLLIPMELTIFYCLPVYTYNTLLFSTGPLPKPMVLYFVPLCPCLTLWYCSIFY